MKRILAILTLAFLTALPQALHACPNCKEAYMEGGGSASSGYSASILFMMITPFVVMGVITFRIALSMRKKKQQESLSFNQN